MLRWNSGELVSNVSYDILDAAWIKISQRDGEELMYLRTTFHHFPFLSQLQWNIFQY